MNFENISVSELFKQTRQGKGLEIKEIAADICVQAYYLEAIEAGDFGKLPEKTFAIGFVKSYACALKLDQESVVKAFKTEIGAVNTKTETLVVTTPIKTPAKKTIPTWLSPLIGFGGAVAVWAWMSGSMVGLSYSDAYDTSIEEAQLAAVTAQLEKVAASEAVSEAEATTPETVETYKKPVHKTEPVKTLTVQKAPPTSLFLPAAHAGEDLSASTQQKVLLEALEDSWVRVANPDGTEVWSGILREGQTFRPETGDIMVLSTSNAGGIKVSVRGENAEVLGTRGTIVSELQFNLSD